VYNLADAIDGCEGVVTITKGKAYWPKTDIDFKK
jgi:hypothetical protein